MRSLIAYFTNRHLLSNVIFFGVILLAIFVWQNIGKEELPEFASDWIRVNTIYPGASAEDVELFVTKPFEDELKGVVGLEEVVTTSSQGVSSLRITIDDNYPDKREVVQEINDAILRADLPPEVRETPKLRQFKSSAKAILDIGLYIEGQERLDDKSRAELQEFVVNFENQLLVLNEISSIDRSHYRKPELQILVDPKKKKQLDISLSEVRNQILSNNIRAPIGLLQDQGESMATALNELEDERSLKDLIVRGNYNGQGIKLGEVANVKKGFSRTNSIFKINGHEGIFLNVQKSISTDILSAQEAVTKLIKKIQVANKDSAVKIVLMDDESYAVTNRLNIVSANGILGFILIVLVLLVFLDVKSGFWVAMGIPFSMGFTIIMAYLAGYTVNNMTLAGIIIVLGIVVDDAIIIAENISRHKEEGSPLLKAAIDGTTEVFKPIIASIITTCVAFVPLIFFEGFFGKLVSYIPFVVILMLLGSLIESIFILPSHMASKTPLLEKFVKKEGEKNWFTRYEVYYRQLLIKVFNFKWIVLTLFICILGGGVYLYKEKMKFVMFPREESKEVFIQIKAKKGTTRDQTARLISPLEKYLAKDLDHVVGVRSSVGLSRRGGEVKENEASILVELLPPDERNTPLDKLLEDWEKFGKTLPDLPVIKFRRGRWGWGSGSAIELQIQENNDQKRTQVVSALSEAMKKIDDLSGVEIEEPLKKNEFFFKIRQERLIKYDVAPEAVTTTLRSFVEGSILYSINKGEEEVDVRLSVPDSEKSNLDELLKLRVTNRQGQLAYLRNIINVEEKVKPVNISRTDYKRTSKIFADLSENSKKTPLEIAEYLENTVFPEIQNKYPSSVLKFRGEIEDSRESQGEFQKSIYVVLIMIYLILVVMFNSITKPLLVLTIIPFGFAGMIYVLIGHGYNVYGFFAVIGALGMIGVVVNDAIVMIDKLEKRALKADENETDSIARVAATRLRPILVTTITTVVGILPTAYGFAGYDSMLSEMMLTMGWGLAFGTLITLFLVPCLYTFSVSTQK